MHLRRKCILLHVNGKSWRYQLSPFGLMFHLSCVSLLIFCFDDLSIGVRGVLKSPNIVIVAISHFMSVIICFMYWGDPVLGVYIFTIVMSLDWSLDHYVVSFLLSHNSLYFKVYSDMRIATPAFFCFSFAWNIFFNPLTFSLYVSWGLKWVSCRQRILGLGFVSIQPVCVF